MYTVWHVDKYKITFKLVINHWTNEILYHIMVSSGQHLGLSFLTHSRIFFSSEYFHYKTFIHENCSENQNNKFQENLSRPGIIDARARYRAAARRLRNTDLSSSLECCCCWLRWCFKERRFHLSDSTLLCDSEIEDSVILIMRFWCIFFQN